MSRIYRESQIQKELCRYVSLKYRTALYNCDLSGVNLSKTQAGLAKAMRSGKGFPDFVLYEPKYIKEKTVFGSLYCGLFIEIKAEGTEIYAKRATDKLGYTEYATDHIADQAMVIEMLMGKGYYACFGIGLDACMKIVDNYMQGKL